MHPGVIYPVTRDDEFSHIPELGPARDVLDQSAIPTLKKTSGASVVQPATRTTGGGLMHWLLLLLMLIMGAAGYWGMEHINLLQIQLIESNGRISSLEGLINATDENANRSGAALQVQMKTFMLNGDKRLKHVDSELAKLWSVAYQRNKPKIAEIDETVANLDKQSVELLAQSQAFDAQLKQVQSVLSKTNAQLQQFDQRQNALHVQLGDLETALQARLADLGGRLQLRDQANQELDSMQDKQMQQIEQRLKKLQDHPAVPDALSLAVKDHEQAIAAINSFRKQANAEFLRLGSQIELLQRNASSVSPAVTSTK